MSEVPLYNSARETNADDAGGQTHVGSRMPWVHQKAPAPSCNASGTHKEQQRKIGKLFTVMDFRCVLNPALEELP
jgi:hypothetical protein